MSVVQWAGAVVTSREVFRRYARGSTAKKPGTARSKKSTGDAGMGGNGLVNLESRQFVHSVCKL